MRRIDTAEELAGKWYDENVLFVGAHTSGMYMNVRDYVDIIMWLSELLPEDFTGSAPRKYALKVLVPIAQKVLGQ